MTGKSHVRMSLEGVYGDDDRKCPSWLELLALGERLLHNLDTTRLPRNTGTSDQKVLRPEDITEKQFKAKERNRGMPPPIATTRSESHLNDSPFSSTPLVRHTNRWQTTRGRQSIPHLQDTVLTLARRYLPGTLISLAKSATRG